MPAARERHIEVLHRLFLETPCRGLAGQAGALVLLECQDADQLRLAVGGPQQVDDSQVQVRHFVNAELLLHDRKLSRLGPEVFAQAAEQNRRRLTLLPGLGCHDFPPEREVRTPGGSRAPTGWRWPATPACR